MSLTEPILLRYFREERGAAAAETAIFVLVLAPIMLNLADLGIYVYKRMQVENAAQAGAQAAYATCTKAPASACTQLTNAVTGAVQGTSLGTGVQWANSSPLTVGNYCPDGTNNGLIAAGSGNCTSTGAKAGYYIRIDVNYNFQPVFTGFSVASLLPTPITRTTWMRIE